MSTDWQKIQKQRHEKWLRQHPESERSVKQQEQEPNLPTQPRGVILGSANASQMKQISESARRQKQRWEQQNKARMEQQRKEELKRARAEKIARDEEMRYKKSITMYLDRLERTIRQILDHVGDYMRLERDLSLFTQDLRSYTPSFKDTDLANLQFIIMSLLEALTSSGINFNVTDRVQKKFIDKLPNIIRELLRIVNLPDDLITFSVEMDTSHDFEVAQALSTE